MVVTLAPKAERKSGGGGNCSLSQLFREAVQKTTLITSFFSKE